MYGKMQAPGHTELVPLLCTLATWDQDPALSHPDAPQGALFGGLQWLRACWRVSCFHPVFPQGSHWAAVMWWLMVVTSFAYGYGRQYFISQPTYTFFDGMLWRPLKRNWLNMKSWKKKLCISFHFTIKSKGMRVSMRKIGLSLCLEETVNEV